MALSELGTDQLAAMVIGSTDRHVTYATTPLSAPQRDRALAVAADLRDRLGDERYEAMVAEGSSLPIADVVHRTRAALIGQAGT